MNNTNFFGKTSLNKKITFPRKVKSKSNFFQNKKATIGATMTWIVATIIILLVIIIFVYLSTTFFAYKKLENLDPFVQTNEQSSEIDSEQILLALMQTEIDGTTIKELIINKEKDILEKIDIIAKLPVNSKGAHWELSAKDNEDEYIFRNGNQFFGAIYPPRFVFLGSSKLKLENNIEVKLILGRYQ